MSTKRYGSDTYRSEAAIATLLSCRIPLTSPYIEKPESRTDRKNVRLTAIVTLPAKKTRPALNNSVNGG